MGRAKVYFMPFTAGGEYESAWVDVSNYVMSIGAIKQQIDATEYDIGVFRNSDVSLVLNNESGIFSDVLETWSMFQFTRHKTKIKITWQPGYHDLKCGFFKCGDGWAILTEEVTVFQGVLDDTATKETIFEQSITFKCLGAESVLDGIAAPYDDIIPGAMYFSTVLHTCLSADGVDKFLTYSSVGQSVDQDFVIDEKTPFLNKTIFDVVKDVLVAANSVLYVDNDLTVHISPRTPSTALKHTFYGLGAMDGFCSIIDITYILGKKRIFNHVSWEEVDVLSVDVDSIALYGVCKKVLSFDFITNLAKQQGITDSIVAEFKNIKKELKIKTTLTVDTLALGMLDKVNVDYPGLILDVGGTTAFYGRGRYGEHFYADEVNNMRIEKAIEWKILSRSIDVVNNTIEFILREI